MRTRKEIIERVVFTNMFVLIFSMPITVIIYGKNQIPNIFAVWAFLSIAALVSMFIYWIWTE